MLCSRLEAMPAARAVSLPALIALVAREPNEYFAVARNIAALSPETFVQGLRSGSPAARLAYAWSARPDDVRGDDARGAIVDGLVDLLTHEDGGVRGGSRQRQGPEPSQISRSTISNKQMTGIR